MRSCLSVSALVFALSLASFAHAQTTVASKN
jgi:hypothetical protein